MSVSVTMTKRSWAPPSFFRRALLLVSVQALALGGHAEVAEALLPYIKTSTYVQESFFDRWVFWQAADPSNGAVNYVSKDEAIQEGMAKSTASGVYLGADMWSKMDRARRRSVRIQSRETYNEGLFVVRVDHVPTGCGLWPAFWLYGEDENHTWPKWGEFDIIEGVHTMSHVMTSLHTTSGCDQSGADTGRRKWDTGTTGDAADNCDIEAPDQWGNQGCVQQGPFGSMGTPLNSGGGGTFAAEWDPMAEHIRTWFWPAGREPPELAESAQRPLVEPSESWGRPYSYFSLAPERCSSTHFANMRLVFDLTFCGDLGESSFRDYCPEVAREMSCADFVASRPDRMTEAYWSIRTLDVYQRRPQSQAGATVIMTDAMAPPGIAAATSSGATAEEREQQQRNWWAMSMAILIACSAAATVLFAALLSSGEGPFPSLKFSMRGFMPLYEGWHTGVASESILGGAGRYITMVQRLFGGTGMFHDVETGAGRRSNAIISL